MADGRVGALGVHGSLGTPRLDHDVCVAALEHAGFTRSGEGSTACWELPKGKLIDVKKAVISSSGVEDDNDGWRGQVELPQVLAATV